jgi:hypothetical protein
VVPPLPAVVPPLPAVVPPLPAVVPPLPAVVPPLPAVVPPLPAVVPPLPAVEPPPPAAGLGAAAVLSPDPHPSVATHKVNSKARATREAPGSRSFAVMPHLHSEKRATDARSKPSPRIRRFGAFPRRQLPTPSQRIFRKRQLDFGWANARAAGAPSTVTEASFSAASDSAAKQLGFQRREVHALRLDLFADLLEVLACGCAMVRDAIVKRAAAGGAAEKQPWDAGHSSPK